MEFLGCTGKTVRIKREHSKSQYAVLLYMIYSLK